MHIDAKHERALSKKTYLEKYMLKNNINITS